MSRSVLRPILALSTATAVAATVLIAAPGSATRAVSESYAVPADGVLQLTGHGFGHGHGMSQYGAEGAARAGRSWQQIMAFYYPGTTLSSATGTIRVLVSGTSVNSLVVANAAGLRVRTARTSTSYAVSGTGVTQWRLRNSGSSTILDSYSGGAWHDGVRTLPGPAELFGPATLGLKVGGATRSYRGALRPGPSGAVDVLGLDDYAKGVVAREMPASWQPQALDSQAVAARTYGAFERSANPNRSYDICDSSACQVYGGVAAEDSRSTAAVVATAGKILTAGGAPAFAQFGSSNGGWTAAGGESYLPAKADPYDGFSGNPVHTWTTTVTRAAVQRGWPSIGTLTRVRVTQRDGNGEWYGRVVTMALDGTRGSVTLSGDTFRSHFGLRSSWFHFGSGSGSGGTTAPTPAPPPAAPATPITARWRAIGGNHSVVGRPRSAEYAVAGGRARVFAHGRIFWKSTTGAHELFGRVLRAYLHRGAAGGRIGFPTTRPHRVARGVAADFEHATLTVYRSGRVVVLWR